jgi:hypothetical protein
MTDDEFLVIYIDRKYGNAYYDRYRNYWIPCSVEHHEEGRALHVDKMSRALVCYGYGNAYYDRYRSDWIPCAVLHEEGRALHVDKKSGALVCYGYGHENNHIRGQKYRIVEIDVDV